MFVFTKKKSDVPQTTLVFFIDVHTHTFCINHPQFGYVFIVFVVVFDKKKILYELGLWCYC